MEKRQVTVEEALQTKRFELRAIELRELERLEFFRELNKEFGWLSRKDSDELHERLQGSIPKFRLAVLKLEKDVLELVKDVLDSVNDLEPTNPRDIREISELENMLGQRTEQGLARLVTKYVPKYLDRFNELYPDSGYLPKED